MLSSCLSDIELPTQPAVARQEAKIIMFQRIEYAPS